MIDKNDAQKQGFNTLNRSEARLRQRDELFQKLKAILPGLIDSDNILNIRALEDAVDLSDTTSNNQGYELTFAGKGLAKAKAEVPTDKELKVEQGQSKNFDSAGNVVIRGDNLDVLKILKQNYAGKIKCIYIDPPYNTENDGFIYSDNFHQSEAQLIEDFGLQEETVNFLHDLYKTKTHSGWLAFMYPRLRLARQLLTEDGVIFISIDDKEQANLKILCDEIFGEDNFVGEIVIIRSEGGGLAKHLVKGHDYALIYAKNINSYTPLKRPKDIRGKIITKGGQEYWIEEDWLRRKFGEYGTCLYEEIEELKGIKKKKEIDQKLKTGEYILIPKDNGTHIVGRLRLLAEDGSKFYSIVKHLSKNGIKDLENLDLIDIFSFPKPVNLIKEFIKGATFLSSQSNDLILDFFAGSGTTGEAVMRLNAEDGGKRKFILVQWDEDIPKDKAAYEFCKKHRLEPVISSITLERLRRAGAKIEEERENKANLFADTPLDTGFRVFSLAPRREIAEENGQYTIAHAGGLSPMDRLYNLLAASCQPLDTPMEEIEKDILYRAGEAVYILGKPKESLEKYKNLPVYIDGYADISLEQFLNLTADEKENVRIVY